MASGFIALNDLKVLCKNKTRFKMCKVTFRKEVDPLPLDKTFKLSELDNFTLTLHKGEVICFADGVNENYANRNAKKAKEVEEE